MNEKYDIDTNSIYFLIDERFLDGFRSETLEFMKRVYYDRYIIVSKQELKTPLNYEDFFVHMRKRKIKIVQACCPYCGHIGLVSSRENLSKIRRIRFCSRCGKGTLYYNSMVQINRIKRIVSYHHSAYELLKRPSDREYNKFLKFDTCHTEVLAIASFIEFVLREYFEMFMFLKYNFHEDNYLKDLITKSYKNDLLNISKANEHYIKAGICHLKKLLLDSVWGDLMDIVNIRNALTHNNGMLDERFKKTTTFEKFKDYIIGDFIFITDKTVNEFLKSSAVLTDKLQKLYLDELKLHIHDIIYNHYSKSLKID